jgi:AAA ATPase-like protein
VDKARRTELTITSLKHATQVPGHGDGPPPRAVAPRAAAAGPGRPRRTPLPIRAAERRRWTADLLGPAFAGLVVHGAGGMGKSTLAAAITARVGQLEPGRVPVRLAGEVSADRLLAALGAALQASPAVAACHTAAAVAAVDAAGRAGEPGADRLARLREHVLGQVPMLVVLDDFDDNTSAGEGPRGVRDPELAGLLRNWLREPGLSRLLITCRHPFELPGAGRGLGVRHLGPLSRSAAAELARSLPACRLLAEAEVDLAWRLLGGHPLAMEYLDSVLGPGQAGFSGVAARLGRAIQARTGYAMPGVVPGARHSPLAGPPPEAEAIALTACDELLGDLWDGLSAAAQAVLTSALVYRVPVPDGAPLLPAGPGGQSAGLSGPLAECAAAGLITAEAGGEPGSGADGQAGGGPGTLSVHRWTAWQLHHRLASGARAAELTGGRRAARLAAGRGAAELAGGRGPARLAGGRGAAELAGGRRAARLAAGPGTAELAAAHRRAAGYWQQRAAAAPQDPGILPELRYHLAEAAALDRESRPAARPTVSAARRRLRAASAVTAFAAVVTGGALAAGHLAASTGQQRGAPGQLTASAQAAPSRAVPSPAVISPAAVRAQAAAWVAAQVSRQLAVACDPAMCAALRSAGFPGRRLLVIRPGAAAPPGAALIIAPPVPHRQLGGLLAGRYTPGLLAGFGSGPDQIEVRAVAAGDAAAYQAGLAADLSERVAAGNQLLGNPSVSATAAARADLAAGRVDSRLLITLATMADTEPVRVLSFGDSGPGAGRGTPQRATEITTGGGPGKLGYLLAFARAQRPPYRPALARIIRAGVGTRALHIEFTAPSPLGLLPHQ